MALVTITNIQLLNNKARFDAPFEFEITFQVMSALKHDLEFRLIYVGSADSSKYDQTLDHVQVGPLQVGLSKFILKTAKGPDINLIPKKDVLGGAALFLFAAYRSQDFFRSEASDALMVFLLRFVWDLGLLII